MMSETRRQKGYIRQAWLVIALAVVYGGALAGVQTTLGPRIAENKRQETRHVIPILIAGADESRTEEVPIEDAAGKPQRVYKALAADGTHLGWVLPAGGQGFADRIELLIGLDAQVSTLTGLYVLDQTETPGLGDDITTEEFLERFRGQPVDVSLVVVKSDPKAPGEILALTGATISSDKVSTIVNAAIDRVKQQLRRRSLAGPSSGPRAAGGPEEEPRQEENLR